MSRWDDGLTWHTRVTVPATSLPVSVAFVTEQVLRVMDDGFGDDFVEALIQAATAQFEEDTDRAAMVQTRVLHLSAFPSTDSGEIVLPGPPLIEVTGITYLDSAGVEQSLAASPADFRVVESGGLSKAKVLPLSGSSWPSVQAQPDAVAITYRCGYETQPEVPGDVRIGISLLVGEMYKIRSLSVHAVHNTPSVVQTRRLWRKVYG